MTQYQRLQVLYRDTLKKYRKFSRRLERNVSNGRFEQLSERKQSQIRSRISRLLRRLEDLKLQLKIAAVTGALVLGLSAGSVKGQGLGPFNRNDQDNPLRQGIQAASDSEIAFVDFDNDGDLDAFVGTGGGAIRYYRNYEVERGLSTPRMELQVGAANPMDGVVFAANPAPDFADIDLDGDPDLFVGTDAPEIRYFRNNAGVLTEQTGAWNTGTKAGNPFNSLFIGPPVGNYNPTFVDIDGDLDLDVFIGVDFYSFGRSVYFFENDDGLGTFVDQTNVSSKNVFFDTYAQDGMASVSFADVDGDLDLDGVTGNLNGQIVFFENQGSSPWVRYAYGVAGDPFYIDVGTDSKPEFVDIDADGDMDLFVGESGSDINFYINNGGVFTLLEEMGNPLVGGMDNHENAVPAFGDIDGDGFVDAFVADKERDIFGYKGRPDPDGRFTTEGRNTDLIGISPNYYTYHQVVLVNLDGDSDLDVFVGDSETGTIHFFQNDGAGNLTQQGTHPLDGFMETTPSDNNFLIKPQFADLDGDGDLDAVIAENVDYYNLAQKYYDNIRFFRNNAGVFTEQTGAWNDVTKAGNPFDGFFSDDYSDYRPEIAMVDIDHDGDPDLIVHDRISTDIQFYINDGVGNFSLEVANNPLSSFNGYGEAANPVFYDLDNDGDLDLFLGLGDTPRGVLYIQNDNTPPQLGTGPTTVNATAGGGPQDLTSAAVSITDDNSYFIEATISITSGYNAAEDVLAFTPSGGITEISNTGGVMVLGGYADVSAWQTALGSVTYENTNGAAVSGTRTINFDLRDNDATDRGSFPGTFDITVNIIGSNSPPAITSTAGVIGYTENDGPVTLDSGLTLADANDANLVSATITIENNYVNGEDVLAFTPSGSVVGSFTAATGILSLSGTDLVSVYQTVLRSVTYENTSENPDPSPRDISIVVNDGTDPSNVIAIGITITPVNDLPVLTVAGPFNYTENSGAQVVDSGVTITDDDNTTLASAEVSISANYVQGEDVLDFTPTANVTGSFDPPTGVLSLSGTASLAEYETALSSVTYENTSDNPSTALRDIEFTVNDGTDNSLPVIFDIIITPLNDAPVLTTSGANLNYFATQAPAVIESSVTIADLDDTNIESATISISNNFVTGEDVLGFTDQNGITGSYNATLGVLTLTGSSSLANYQTALASVTYDNSNATPTLSVRTVDFLINDGDDDSNIASSTVTVNAMNNPPVINPGNATIQAGGPVDIDLGTLVSDPDGNIDLSSLSVTVNPISGAPTSISGSTLTVDYTGLQFVGTDVLTVEVCDLLGVCAENQITIEVTTEDIFVYNAVSPNGDGRHDFLEIAGIEDKLNQGIDNQVEIYNRWGDQVFVLTNYNNDDRVFTGQSDGGGDLPTGTYYYIVKLSNGQEVTGFFLIKR